MSASGRLQPFVLLEFKKFERPLLRKAAVQTGARINQVPSDWDALKSGRSTDRIVRGKKRPKADLDDQFDRNCYRLSFGVNREHGSTE